MHQDGAVGRGCGSHHLLSEGRSKTRISGQVPHFTTQGSGRRGETQPRIISACTERVTGVQDAQFQALVPDPLQFWGVMRIYNFISMSDMKYTAIVNTGITIENQVKITKELMPLDASVEITAKVFHGYNTANAYRNIGEEEQKKTKGRESDYHGKESTKEENGGSKTSGDKGQHRHRGLVRDRGDVSFLPSNWFCKQSKIM